MSHITITYQEIEKIQRGRLLSSGAEGICYFLNEKTLFKLYKGLYLNRKIFCENLKSNSIAFPIDVYYYENTGLIQGYSMKYMRGNQLISGFSPFLVLDALKEAYQKIKKEIEKYPDIYMNDLFLRNILYDIPDNEFRLIDTGSWYFKEQSLVSNLSNFNLELMKAFCDYTLDFFNSTFYENKKLRELYDLYLNKINEKDLFLLFLEEIQKEKDKVKVIGDIIFK